MHGFTLQSTAWSRQSEAKPRIKGDQPNPMNTAPRGAAFIHARAGGNGASTHAAGGNRRTGPARGASAQDTRKG